ncbi:MAG: 3'(2'),5'-bisphosphate nucleotidase [Microgenomates group bacterium Gr01-1014_16]|nr:MAG: 3'(2'),5'-bisphosphate nucleotidase [Microgenomates group bacterium Gr01-1014_16]
MSDQIKKLAPLIWSEIQKASKILMHCHRNPDGDSVGGVLASKFALESLGKSVTVIWGDSPPPTTLSSVPGYASILRKNWFEINPTDFDLFLAQDSSSLGQISNLGEVKFPENLTVIVIDHHVTNDNYGKINLVGPSYPAVCQILYDLFSLWDIKLTPDIALCLFTGIYTDTGGFKYPLVTKETFQIAAKLAETGADFPKLIFEMENSQDPKSIEYMGMFFSSVEHYFGGNVAVCSITRQQLLEKQIDLDIDVPELANAIKSAVGNEIGISLTEKDQDVIRVSMRTRGNKYDLSKIAVATGAGGGHPVAAGATIKKPMAEAKKFLLETIQKVYPDLGRP